MIQSGLQQLQRRYQLCWRCQDAPLTTPLPLRGSSSLRLAWQVQPPLLCWLLLPSVRQKNVLFLHPGLLWELHTAHSNIQWIVLHYIHPKLASRRPFSKAANEVALTAWLRDHNPRCSCAFPYCCITLVPVSFTLHDIAYQWLQYDLRRRCCCCLAIAGVRQLLQYPSLPDDAQHFAAVEGLSCRTGLLDGPASLLTSLLACGSTSDASLAAIQAGQSALCDATTTCRHEQAHLHGNIWAITILQLLT